MPTFGEFFGQEQDPNFSDVRSGASTAFQPASLLSRVGSGLGDAFKAVTEAPGVAAQFYTSEQSPLGGVPGKQFLPQGGDTRIPSIAEDYGQAMLPNDPTAEPLTPADSIFTAHPFGLADYGVQKARNLGVPGAGQMAGLLRAGEGAAVDIAGSPLNLLPGSKLVAGGFALKGAHDLGPQVEQAYMVGREKGFDSPEFIEAAANAGISTAMLAAMGMHATSGIEGAAANWRDARDFQKAIEAEKLATPGQTPEFYKNQVAANMNETAPQVWNGNQPKEFTPEAIAPDLPPIPPEQIHGPLMNAGPEFMGKAPAEVPFSPETLQVPDNLPPVWDQIATKQTALNMANNPEAPIPLSPMPEPKLPQIWDRVQEGPPVPPSIPLDSDLATGGSKPFLPEGVSPGFTDNREYGPDTAGMVHSLLSQAKQAGIPVRTDHIGSEIVEYKPGEFAVVKGTAGILIKDGVMTDFGSTHPGSLDAAGALITALREGGRPAPIDAISPDSAKIAQKVAEPLGMSYDELSTAPIERIFEPGGRIARIEELLTKRWSRQNPATLESAGAGVPAPEVGGQTNDLSRGTPPDVGFGGGGQEVGFTPAELSQIPAEKIVTPETGAKAASMEVAAENLAKGKKYPVEVTQLEDGTLKVTDGRHTLQAAVDAGKQDLPVAFVDKNGTRFTGEAARAKLRDAQAGLTPTSGKKTAGNSAAEQALAGRATEIFSMAADGKLLDESGTPLPTDAVVAGLSGKDPAATDALLKSWQRAKFSGQEGSLNLGGAPNKYARSIEKSQARQKTGTAQLNAKDSSGEPDAPAIIKGAQSVLQVYDTTNNLTRRTVSGLDQSTSLRQGAWFTMNPRTAGVANKATLRAARGLVEKNSDFWTADPEAMQKWNDREVVTHPRYQQMVDAGLALTHLKGKEGGLRDDVFSQRLEKVMSGLEKADQKLGGYQQKAENAALGTMNQMRIDMFDFLAGQIEKKTGSPLSALDAKDLAAYVNTGTGFGKIPDFLRTLEPVYGRLGFSPRLVASRLQLAASPLYAATLRPNVRALLMKDLASNMATTAMTLGAAAALGASVNMTNYKSPDWLKIKVGDVRVDIMGGVQQALRFYFNQIEQAKKTVSKQGHYGEKDNLQLAERFGRSKLAPLAGLGVTAFQGKNYTGQDFDARKANDWARELADMMLPMTPKDIYDSEMALYKQGGLGAVMTTGLPIGLYSFFGGSVTTYSDRQRNH